MREVAHWNDCEITLGSDWGKLINDDSGNADAVKEKLKKSSLKGLKISVQGLGHVGTHLVDYLHKDGADLYVTDIDGNVYETVQIGNQLWMKENLKVTHYNDGSEIPTGLDNATWTSTNEGAYVFYDDDPANAEIYGNLYNWY